MMIDQTQIYIKLKRASVKPTEYDKKWNKTNNRKIAKRKVVIPNYLNFVKQVLPTINFVLSYSF